MNKFIKSRYLSKLLVSSLACAVLASCGGDVDETPRSQRPIATPTPSPAPVVTPTPAPIEPATVSVDLSTQQFIGASEKLERNKFLNMHDPFSANGAPLALVERYKMEYNIGVGRRFWSPLTQPELKESLTNNGTYLTTEDAQNIGPGRLAGDLNDPRLNLIDANRIVITDHPDNLLFGGLANDPIDGARWAADYFTYYYNDETRPNFYEPVNEPFVNANKFVNIYGDEATVRSQVTAWHKELGKEFRSRPELVDMKIIGFASAFPSFENRGFANWRSTMGMFMDEAGEYVDAFSVHLYDGVNLVGEPTRRSGSNSQAILDLIETNSMAKFGEVKPHAITEYGNIVKRPADSEYDAVANTQDIKTFNHIMLELMSREDRILTSIPFITGYSEFHWQSTEIDNKGIPVGGNGNPFNPSLWRPQLDKIELVGDRWQLIDPNDPDNYVLNDKVMFLEFWKDVLGRRAMVTNIDPDVQVAAFVDGDTAYVIMSNLETEEKKVTLNLKELVGYNYTSVKTEHLFVPNVGSEEKPTNTMTDLAKTGAVDGGAFEEVTLAASDTIKYTITLDKSIEAAATAQSKTYYASENIVGIAKDRALSFSFNDIDLSTLDKSMSTAELRMSISRGHDKSKQPVLTINGNTLAVPMDWPGYDQIDRTVFFGAITIPVPFDMLMPNTEVVATFPDSTGQVSSMVLEINKMVDPDTLSVPVESVTLGDGGLSVLLGETRRINPTVLPKNATDKSLTWESSNPDVAAIDENGFVMASNEGSTTITATSVSQTNVSGTTVLTVTLPTPPPTPKPEPTATPVPTPTPIPNFVSDINPDFEQPYDDKLFRIREAGNPVDTNQVNAGTVKQSAEAARDSNGGLELDNSGGNVRMFITIGALSGDFDPTKAHVIKIDAKVVSGKHKWFTNYNNPGSGKAWQGVTLESADWMTYSRVYPANSIVLTANGFAFHMDPDGTGGVVYVDNIRFEQVEP